MMMPIARDYADLMARIDPLLEELRPYPETNETPEGRVRGILLWLKREIAAGRIPIPLDRSYWASLDHFAASGDLANVPSASRLLPEVALILDGEGLVQPEDYLGVADMISDFRRHYGEVALALRPNERKFSEALQDIRSGLRRGDIVLPLDEREFLAGHPAPGWMRPLSGNLNLSREQTRLFYTLFAGATPRRRSDLPLAAPVPGLPPRAEEFAAWEARTG